MTGRSNRAVRNFNSTTGSLLRATPALCAAILIASCSPPGTAEGPYVWVGRWTLLETYAGTTMTSEQGVLVGMPGSTVSVRISTSLPGPTPQPPPPPEQWITHAEIDWGDGTGFHDYIADYRSKWWEPGDYPPSDPAHLTSHTYTEPGEYTIDGRVTYWDGEVVYVSFKKLVRIVAEEP